MDLIDRFGRAHLGMAIFQGIVFLIVVIYALVPPSLGTHAVMPALLMTVVFAALIAMTLFRPWDVSAVDAREGPWSLAEWVLWPPWLIVGITLGLGTLYRGVFEGAKETVQDLTRSDVMRQIMNRSDDEAWEADTWGASLVSGPDLILVFFLPAALLGLLWWALSR